MKSPGPSAYALLQQAEALMERVNNLGLKAQPVSKRVSKLVDEAADKLASAVDELQKEVERRRKLREEYERALKHTEK